LTIKSAQHTKHGNQPSVFGRQSRACFNAPN